MSVWIVIPARYASTRFPGKPLAELTGASGFARSLVRRSWDAAMEVDGVSRVAVATDDERIADHCRSFGAEVVMTSAEHRNGTERCAEAVAAMGEGAEIVVNLQGDAPLTPPWFVEALISAMRANAEAAVATPVLRADPRLMASLIEDRKADRVGATTAVFDRDFRALYFSKEVLPFTGRALKDGEVSPVFHHVGVYAYRPAALIAYGGMLSGPLEQWEGLEQLRFMENGQDVLCVEVESRGAHFWELNNPEDVPRIEAVLKERGLD